MNTTDNCFSEFDINEDSQKSQRASLWSGEDIVVGENITHATGNVIDEFGSPVPNANVYLQSNTNKGASTNSNGEFSIDSVEHGTVIIISHIGFNTKSYIHQGAYKNIELFYGAEELDEVVITSEPKKNYAFALMLGAVAVGTLAYNMFGSKSKSSGLGATKKRKHNVVKVVI